MLRNYFKEKRKMNQLHFVVLTVTGRKDLKNNSFASVYVVTFVAGHPVTLPGTM
jgi:hypothetical protein